MQQIKSFQWKKQIIESEIIALSFHMSLSLSLAALAMEKHAPWDWRQSEMPKLNIIHDTRTISNYNNTSNGEQTNEHNNLSKQINK